MLNSFVRVFSGLRPSWYGELSRSDDSPDVVNPEHAQGRVNETYPHRRHTGGHLLGETWKLRWMMHHPVRGQMA